MIKIVNFCGGRGSNSIIGHLLKYPHVRLTNIVNAYDDGKSTGSIRQFFRMLGPSDIRKTQVSMMNKETDQDIAVSELFKFRFPEEIDHNIAISTINGIINNQNDPFQLNTIINRINNRRKYYIRNYLNTFIENLRLYEKAIDTQFPFGDCSIANCMYAGAYEFYDRDFGLAIEWIGKLLNMKGETITNSLENRYLLAIREDGIIMNSEAEIVESRANVRIHQIFIVDRTLTNSEKNNLNKLSIEEKVRYLDKFSKIPIASRECLDSILKADIILYSPGTQHSSLYPTYMTRHISESIRKNRDALKVFVANIGEDYETPAYSVFELVEGAIKHLKMSDRESHPVTNYIQYILANSEFEKKDKLSKYIKYDPEKVEKIGLKCISASFEDSENWGKHNGEKIVNYLFELLEQINQKDII
jgi:2-phospho-L-lactate transferase/gluconeogenesis factor (CofD/UPF0052 family)